jgi:ubiquinone/menaquinone biosynthesis C-methylase UbiE
MGAGMEPYVYIVKGRVSGLYLGPMKTPQRKASRKPSPAQRDAKPGKQDVKDFWNRASCGEEAYALGKNEAEQLNAQARERYRLEPYLPPFANFPSGKGKTVLEVGVGMGADHLEWAKHGPKALYGVDLTPRAIAFTKARFKHAKLASTLQVADAEALPFKDGMFNLVYSWGVLHHSPDTPKAFAEVARVLKKGGTAKIMVYHTYSLTGLMLWARYGLLKGNPFLPLSEVYSRYLESPGTKAYTVGEAAHLCQQAGFANWTVRIQLNHGDLLEGEVGQRHKGGLLSMAKKLWPRGLIRNFLPFLGLYLLIEARK